MTRTKRPITEGYFDLYAQQRYAIPRITKKISIAVIKFPCKKLISFPLTVDFNSDKAGVDKDSADSRIMLVKKNDVYNQ
jgi:hypothetical protein